MLPPQGACRRASPGLARRGCPFGARSVYYSAMEPALRVRTLEPDDATSLIALRREALVSAPLAFAASPEDDVGLSLDFVRSSLGTGDNSAVFGAFLGERIVGMAGVAREGKRKFRHKAIVWGMFVTPDARRSGAGTALLAAAIERARSWPGVVQVHLSVSETAEDARRLYARAGFREWGNEPRALEWDGRFADERHLVLDIA